MDAAGVGTGADMQGPADGYFFMGTESFGVHIQAGNFKLYDSSQQWQADFTTVFPVHLIGDHAPSPGKPQRRTRGTPETDHKTLLPSGQRKITPHERLQKLEALKIVDGMGSGHIFPRG